MGYLALSYCWGKDQFEALKAENYESFKNGISLSLLPQTIKDAISVTRRLGYRYQWVDSLCIFQDSEDDFEIESASMCEVYRNAVCTIAAVKSSKASEGFLASHDPLEMAPCLLSVSKSSCPSKQSQVYARPQSTTAPLSWQMDVTMSRWNHRAWCFQEMVLSRKILYFGRSQIHASVQKPILGGLRRFSTANTVWDAHDDSDLIRSFNQDDLDVESEHVSQESYSSRRWWDFVLEFSQRSLSRSDNKLPAIAGIADYVWESGLKSNYITGLWEATLPRDLLWYVSSGIRERRPLGPRGPT
jgi:hypothetical protein